MAAGASPARGEDTLALPRLPGPVVVDGRVDEAAWDDVPVLPITVITPQYRAEPTERTEIRVAYDDTYLYMSGRLFDSDPSSVRANSLYRDAFAGDDLLCIAMDTYYDRETAAWFCVNPAGSRIDQTLRNDGESTAGPPLNLDWNTYWDAKASRDETGWSAEMRIPFTSLGFQDVDGRVVMGLEVYRYIGRKAERHMFPDIPPSAGYIVKPSLMQPVSLEGVHRRQPVYVTPYGLGGWEQNALLNDPGTGFDVARDYTAEAGLDVRYSPAANLSLDLSANTDFAQVEADDLQINLTRFPLFFPEKRQFFQERAEIFNFPLGGPFNRLFHSRRIGLVEGQPIRLYGGARLVGRAGGADFGVLNMQTGAAFGRPSENFGVARVRQRVLNENSTVGGMVTTRLGADGSYNVAAGLDGVVRVFGNDYATLSISRTFENDAPAGGFDAAHLLFLWERRTVGGLSYAADVNLSGKAFNPAVGFIDRHDYTSLVTQLQYLWFTGPTTPLRTLSVRGSGRGFRRNADGSMESGILTPGLGAEFKNGSTLDLDYRANYESVRDAFSLAPGVDVPPGDYWYHDVELAYSGGTAGLFQPSVSLIGGQFYDGRRFAIRGSAVWNAAPPHLQLTADYSFDAIRFPDRDLSVDVHLARLRVSVAFDTHLSIHAFVQYDSVADVASVNARLRYEVRDGTDLWIVYNEAVNTDRYSLMPVPPLSRGRALLVKYTHTLAW
jgi:hypothetical protein